jgi:hypothetical protein
MHTPYPIEKGPGQFVRDVRLVLSALRNAGVPEVEHVEAARDRLRLIDGVSFLELMQRVRPGGAGPDLGL